MAPGARWGQAGKDTVVAAEARTRGAGFWRGFLTGLVLAALALLGLALAYPPVPRTPPELTPEAVTAPPPPPAPELVVSPEPAAAPPALQDRGPEPSPPAAPGDAAAVPNPPAPTPAPSVPAPASSPTPTPAPPAD